MKSNLFSYLILSAIFAMVSTSCSKDYLSPTADNPSSQVIEKDTTLTIQAGKDYYNNILKKIAIPTRPSRYASKQLILNNSEADFTKAIESESSKFYSIESPFTPDIKRSFIITDKNTDRSIKASISQLDASFERLIIYKNKRTGAFHQRIIIYIPDKNCLNSNPNDIKNNHAGALNIHFNGWLVYQTWARKTLFALEIKKGKSIRKLTINSPYSGSSKGFQSTSTSSLSGCEQEWVEELEYQCYTVGVGNNAPTQTCMWDETGNGHWETFCPDDDSDVDPTCYETGDCGDGTNTGDDMEDWDSGNDGADGSPTVILDESLTPCQTAVLNDLKNMSASGQGMLAYIVQKFGGNATGYNWRFVSGNLPFGTFGSTGPYDKTHRVITTTFDARQMRNASDLSVARTMLHEAVHAYVVTYFANSPQYANASYPDLVAAYAAAGAANPNIPHHNFMGQQNWLSDLAWGLQQYGINRGHSLPDQYYADMAWGGLEASIPFLSLPPADQNRISNLLRVEATGRDLSGNSQPQAGHSAGCP
jgi:hypothetical protein